MTAEYHFDGKHPDRNDLFTIIFIGTIRMSKHSFRIFVGMRLRNDIFVGDLIIIFLISFS